MKFGKIKCENLTMHLRESVLSTLGVRKESFNKFLTGNRFHIKYASSVLIQLESSQKDESRAQFTDSLKADRKPRELNSGNQMKIALILVDFNSLFCIFKLLIYFVVLNYCP